MPASVAIAAASAAIAAVTAVAATGADTATASAGSVSASASASRRAASTAATAVRLPGLRLRLRPGRLRRLRLRLRRRLLHRPARALDALRLSPGAGRALLLTGSTGSDNHGGRRGRPLFRLSGQHRRRSAPRLVPAHRHRVDGLEQAHRPASARPRCAWPRRPCRPAPRETPSAGRPRAARRRRACAVSPKASTDDEVALRRPGTGPVEFGALRDEPRIAAPGRGNHQHARRPAVACERILPPPEPPWRQSSSAPSIRHPTRHRPTPVPFAVAG